MFKSIRKIKENNLRIKKLKKTVSELRKELSALKEKRPIDLTRECLGMLPLTVDFESENPKYSSNQYLNNVAALADNNTLEEEMRRIVFDCTQHIATASPNEQSSLLSRGEISGVVKLLQRACEARDFIEYKKREERGLSEEES